MPGRLISFEGIDGVGKSTQLELARRQLEAAGQIVLSLREPGGTAAGEALRELIKAGSFSAARAELLAFSTARAELVEARIRPALGRGELVLLDRFTDSSLAYQGALGELSIAEIRSINHFATGGLQPDLTLWLDLPVELARARRRQAGKPAGGGGSAESSALDSIEQRDAAYFSRVRDIFAQICREEPQRFIRIDVSGSSEQVAGLVMERLAVLLEAAHG